MFSDQNRVRRVKDPTGSHVEPPLQDFWSSLEKLQWRSSLLRFETGLSVSVCEMESGGFSIQCGPSSIGSFDFHEAWLFLTGISSGALEVRRTQT